MHHREALRAFEKLGWVQDRQVGSHIIMVKDGEIASLSVPAKNPIAKGTLRSLIRSAGITVDEFKNALK
ncbi:MAG: type II toxin-antitoxin system HicA family toxin [Gemmataceae bacterium]|nr:type II toxin-antitoxin system HicA family toxin [Gemmataceae bacterium]